MNTIIRITPDGLRAIPGDERGELLLQKLGCPAPMRASHVDIVPGSSPWKWTADMSPLFGPVLGPFASREEALAAEHEWVVKNWLTAPLERRCPDCEGHGYRPDLQYMRHPDDPEPTVPPCPSCNGEGTREAYDDQQRLEHAALIRRRLKKENT